MKKRIWWRVGAVILAVMMLAGFVAGVSAVRPLTIFGAVGESSARGMCVLDVASGRVLFSKNPDQQMGMASTTKIVTALTVLENYQDLDTPVTIPDAAVGIEGSSIYLQKGEKLTVRELLYGLMLRSGNDAAVALALTVAGDVPAFATLMNQTAEKYGATRTHFTNPHGLDDEQHYTTAYDLAKLTAVALQNPVFAEIVATKEKRISGVTIPRVLINKNKLLKTLDGCIGVKTGFTKKTGRCFVGAREVNGQKIVGVVLNCGPMFPETKQLLTDAFMLYPQRIILNVEQLFTDYHGQQAVAVDNFVYPLTAAERESLVLEIIGQEVSVQLAGKEIYRGACVPCSK